MKPGTEKAVLPYVEKLWMSEFPDYAYDYKFLDQTIENFYKQENQLAQLYKIFAGIAIFISCLGLYGLVSFMAVQRTKEVGIRKVLGASVRNIVYLLSKEFTILIIIAFIISAPIAWYIMHQWLQNYYIPDSFDGFGFYYRNCRFCFSCLDNSCASRNKSSNGQSCEEFENRVIS